MTSAANNLHKAHAKYLEARLIEEARSIKRINLENGTTPSRSGLSEAAQANMESFLDYLLMILPALRIDMFIKNTREVLKPAAAAAAPNRAGTFELNSQSNVLHATAFLQDGEFVVEKSSLARSEWVGLDLCVPIETKTIAGKAVNSIGGGALIVCLADGLTKDTAEPLGAGIVAWRTALAPAVDTRVVFKDSGFADDIAKTNMAAILNQNGIFDVRSL